MTRNTKTPVLFLDFDGVLNTWRTRTIHTRYGARIRNFTGLDERNIGHLNRLCRRNPRLRIVVSSAWREMDSLASLRRILTMAGFRYAERVIGVTPVWMTNERGNIVGCHPFRGDEIRTWLNRHGGPRPYAIVDDLYEEEFRGHEGHFVRTSPSRDGLTHERMLAIEAALRGEPIPPLPLRLPAHVLTRREIDEYLVDAGERYRYGYAA